MSYFLENLGSDYLQNKFTNSERVFPKPSKPYIHFVGVENTVSILSKF